VQRLQFDRVQLGPAHVVLTQVTLHLPVPLHVGHWLIVQLGPVQPPVVKVQLFVTSQVGKSPQAVQLVLTQPVPQEPVTHDTEQRPVLLQSGGGGHAVK
jgi:hypothetical protein